MRSIVPVVLSGGAGKRLWPLSRRDHPKQFLTFFGEHSLLQATCLRLTDPLFAPALIVANADHRFLAAQHLHDIGFDEARVLVEPVARSTAAAAMSGILAATDGADDRLVLVQPSDHLIADTAAFVGAVRGAMRSAEEGNIVLFGVRAEHPAPDFGYITLEGNKRPDGAHGIAEFHEKPALEQIESLLGDGRVFWNAGMFLGRAGVFKAAFSAFAPDILGHARAALASARADLDFEWLGSAPYEAMRAVSLDRAVIEKARNLTCIALDAGWRDAGSWPALAQAMAGDQAGNVIRGDVEAIGTSDCLLISTDVHLGVAGLDGLTVVATGDAVLVTSRAGSGDVRGLVSRLEAKGRHEAIAPRRVHRPWGWFERLSGGEGYQVKCLKINPGGKLSLQSHARRAEHWVVTSGRIRVTIGGDERLLNSAQSTFIPPAAKHRLENVGPDPAMLIEVQSGAYLEEDDIVRYEDIYNRCQARSSGNKKA